MIRQFRTPIYLAATTNSRSRRLIVIPRTMRELIIQLNADNSTIIQKMSPLVRCTTIMISRKLGTTIIRSTSHISGAVAPAAEVTGDSSRRGGDQSRDERDAHTDQHRFLHAAQCLGQQILAEPVRAEPVVGAGGLLQCEIVQIAVVVRQQRRQGVAADEHQQEHAQAIRRRACCAGTGEVPECAGMRRSATSTPDLAIVAESVVTGSVMSPAPSDPAARRRCRPAARPTRL